MTAEPTPEMAAILKMVEEQGLPPWEQYSHAEARRLSIERNAFWNEANPDVARVDDVLLETKPKRIAARIYVPSDAETNGPAIVFFHGGGWVICSIDTHDGVCRRLANASGLRVISVDYALAPEHPFPEPLNDCVAAFEAVRASAWRYGVDPDRLAVAGDSAGANLAMALLLRQRDADAAMPKAAALIYGAYDAGNVTPSQQEWGGGGYILSTATMKWFWDAYVPDKSQTSNPYVAPLYADDLSGLPPLYLSAAELDPLKDDTVAMVARLEAAGIDVTYSLWQGVTHACIMFSRMLPDADRELEEVGAFLKQKLS